MYDSGLLENMWDMASGAATHDYIRTPQASNNMVSPLKKFNSKYEIGILQIKCFGSICYMEEQ